MAQEEGDDTASSAEDTSADAPHDSRWKAGRRALWRLLKPFLKEAVDFQNEEDWPPWWIGVALRLAALLALLAVAGRILETLGAIAIDSDIATPVRAALYDYAAIHPISDSLDPGETIGTWAAFGLLLFVASYFGNVGGRIGWCLFGLVSSSMVYGGAPAGREWTLAGLTAILWSALSISGFRKRKIRRPKRRPGQKTDEERLDEHVANSGREAKRLGFKDLDTYFGERGNQKLDTIAEELKISKKYAGPLRARYIESGISTQSNLSPRVQRLIIADLRAAEYSDSELCDRHDCRSSDIQRARKYLASN